MEPGMVVRRRSRLRLLLPLETHLLMELSLNTLTFQNRPLSEALAAARAAGITSLELAATPGCRHLDPLAGRDAWEALRRELEGFQVVAVSAEHPGLPCLDAEGGDDAVSFVIQACHAAKALGARLVTTSLGSTEVDAWDSAWSRATGALQEILGRSARAGVRLAVEIHQDDVLNSLRKARRLLDEIPNPRLGLTLDTAFLHYNRIQLSEALLLTGERLFHVHLRDATRRDPFRAIGHGEISFPAVLRALHAHGYNGALSLELHKTEERHSLPVSAAVAEGAEKLRAWLEALPATGDRPEAAVQNE